MAHEVQDCTVNRILLFVLLLQGCALVGAQPAADNAADDGYTHCGRLLWPTDQAAVLPLPDGIEVSSSTSAAVRRVVSERGSWTLRFVYEDGVAGTQLLREAVDRIIASGHNQVCVFASTVTNTADGLPFEVSPLRSPKHGRMLDDASEVGLSGH